MDISNQITGVLKQKVEEAIAKCKKDPSILTALTKTPVETLKKLGISVDTDMVEKVVNAIKAGVTADKASSALNTLKGLFGK